MDNSCLIHDNSCYILWIIRVKFMVIRVEYSCKRDGNYDGMGCNGGTKKASPMGGRLGGGRIKTRWILVAEHQ